MSRLPLLLPVFAIPILLAAQVPGPGGGGCQAFDVLGGDFSGENTRIRAADSFRPAETGFVSNVTWRGYYLDDTGESVPGPEDAYEITYYKADSTSATPGTLHAGPFPVVPQATDTGTMSSQYKIFEFQASHAPVLFECETCYWIEIVNNTLEPLRRFVWIKSTTGDGRSASSSGRGQLDYAFCLDTPLLPAGSCEFGSSETGQFTSTLSVPGDRFGTSVSMDGVRILVGDPFDNTVQGADVGSSIMFRWNGTEWEQEARLLPAENDGQDGVGTSVGLSAMYAAIGAPRADAPTPVAGAAYVYMRSGPLWNLQTKLTALDAATDDEFGTALFLDGNTTVIGAPGDDDNGSASGSAYVYVGAGSTWGQQGKLLASDGAAGDGFGSSVSLDGDRVVVGSPQLGTGAGAAYVFERSGSVWSEVAQLIASDGALGDEFGASVGIFGDNVVVGAPAKPEAGPDSGAAYIFTFDGSTWSEARKLVPDDALAGARFGVSVAAEMGAVLVGAPLGGNPVETSGIRRGAGYLYSGAGSTWFLRSKAMPMQFNRDTSELCGSSVSMSGDWFALGTPFDDLGTGFDRGSVTTFSRASQASGASFCDATDGALFSCPCGNLGDPDSGCEIQQGTGGVRLCTVEQLTGAENRVTMQGTGYPLSATPTSIVIRSNALDPSRPVVFGDGLRCVGVPLVRLAATFAASGSSNHSFGHGPMAGSGSFHYQLWFRNTPAMYCTPDAFNLSNGRTLDW